MKRGLRRRPASNLDPVGLKLLSEDLEEFSDEDDKRPANDDAVH